MVVFHGWLPECIMTVMATIAHSKPNRSRYTVHLDRLHVTASCYNTCHVCSAPAKIESTMHVCHLFMYVRPWLSPQQHVDTHDRASLHAMALTPVRYCVLYYVSMYPSTYQFCSGHATTHPVGVMLTRSIHSSHACVQKGTISYTAAQELPAMTAAMLCTMASALLLPACLPLDSLKSMRT